MAENGKSKARVIPILDEDEIGTEREVREDPAGSEQEEADDDVQVWVVDDQGEHELDEATAASDEVEALRRELARTKDQWLRTVADLDNFRKRSEREQREARRYALFEPVRDMLGVLDNLERALEAGGSIDDLKQGVEMTLKQFRDTLKNHGVTAIEAVGAPFDPNLHDAVSRSQDPDVETPMVASELQRGYMMHDRLLRPAMVTVAMPADEAKAKRK